MQDLGINTAITHIGRYDVISEVGRGGMGVVYRGEDKLIGREIAIKTLTETTPELRERFLIEARSGILNHPNIVTVYELGEHEGTPYIAMEFVAGESVENILHSGRGFSLLETLSIIEQLCSGLGYAHQNGVLHRDIKPANLIVQPDGRVKIVDFGIARLSDQATRLTKTDAIIGTFHYIAPERLKGEVSDGRSDIWSVGVVLYEMITGELPFKGQDVSTLYKVIHQPYPPLRTFIQDVPEALAGVVAHALAKNSADRYGTAEEMGFDLQVISTELKKERIGDLIISARRLMEQRQLTGARTVLFDLQRIDPQNVDAKRLMRDIQEELGRMQKAEQIRQLVQGAEEAILSQHYEEALSLYKQATQLDPENILRLSEKLDNAQSLKDKQEKIRSFWQQAAAARERGDFASAQDCLSKALKLDERNTDLRNAYLTILREIEQKDRESKLNDLLQVAGEQYSSRHYTEAIARLQEASEIDATHPEVRKLLHDATTRQEEERRRQLLEQIISEIQEALYQEDYDKALTQLNRVLERLPSEASLLRLKAETEKKKREFQGQQIVRSAAERAEELFVDTPQEALSIVESALEQVPGADRLVQLKLRLEEHLKRLKQDQLLARYMKQAHAQIDIQNYDEAIRMLEAALIDCGASEDLNYLLEFTRIEQQNQLRQQQSRMVTEEAQALMRAGQYASVIARLESIAATPSDASIQALLEQARRSLQEAIRRAEVVVSHARSLAASDLHGALVLLDGQPTEVLEQGLVSELRRELHQKIEVDDAIQQAVARSEKTLAENDLSSGMEVFESVRRAYGESPMLSQAMDDYEKNRLPIANTMLAASIDAARKALLRNGAKEALEELRRSANARNFADADLKEVWERLLDEATKAAGMKSRVDKDSLSIIVREKSRAGLFLAIGLVAVAFAAGIGVWRVSQRSQAPVPPPTYLEINASPWAVIQQITDVHGKKIDLPGVDHSTPMRLERIPPGNYKVAFQGADNVVQVQSCQLSLEQHLCMATFSEPDIKQMLSGDQQ